MVRWVNMEETPKRKGRPPTYTKEILDKILVYIRGGMTVERAAEGVGIPEGTIREWMGSVPAFSAAVKKARRELELNLLNSINEAGVKSWQAKAWMAERVFGYAQPSSRVDVKAELNHGLSPNLAAMLAGIHSRPTTYVKQSQVIDTQRSLDNVYCATNKPAKIPAGKVEIDKLSKRKLVRLRKLQRTTTTPPGGIPSPQKFAHTPPEICDQNKKDHGETAQEQTEIA